MITPRMLYDAFEATGEWVQASGLDRHEYPADDELFSVIIDGRFDLEEIANAMNEAIA